MPGHVSPLPDKSRHASIQELSNGYVVKFDNKATVSSDVESDEAEAQWKRQKWRDARPKQKAAVKGDMKLRSKPKPASKTWFTKQNWISSRLVPSDGQGTLTSETRDCYAPSSVFGLQILVIAALRVGLFASEPLSSSNSLKQCICGSGNFALFHALALLYVILRCDSGSLFDGPFPT